MNTATESPLPPNLEGLRKAVQEFYANPRRVPFHNLKPFHESIVELRCKEASYSLIAELLQQHGVKTSRARVAEYGRVMLDGGKRRKRRKNARRVPAAVFPASTPVELPATEKTMPVTVPTNSGDLPSPTNSTSAYQSRGPRIANVRMMKPEQREQFEADLKSRQHP